MREIELKSVVKDVAEARRKLEAAGALLLYEGDLIDFRYGDAAGSLVQQDHVLRLRIYRSSDEISGSLDWKGPTIYTGGYKVREELSTSVTDPDALAKILGNLGFVVIRDIERHIVQYTIGGATVRFETYPRMDQLVEVEGPPESIERAIAVTGLEREGFSSDRLPDFVARYEARSGQRAALSSRELAGDYRYRSEDA